MHKWQKGTLWIALTMVTVISIFHVGMDIWIHAEDSEPITYTGDAVAYELEENTGIHEQVTLRFFDEEYVALSSVSFYVDGILYEEYTLDENGEIQVQVDSDNTTVVIEPTVSEIDPYYEFSPNMVTLEQGNIESVYEFRRLGIDQPIDPDPTIKPDMPPTPVDPIVQFTFVGKTAEDMQDDHISYGSDETASIELSYEDLEATIYYGIGDSEAEINEYEEYQNAIEITATKTPDTIKICAYAQAEDATSDVVCKYIDFKESDEETPPQENPDPKPMEPQPSTELTFSDENGNVYGIDAVTLQIDSIDDYTKYAEVIKDYPEFSDMKDDHIQYFMAKLLADGMEVQPNMTYELVLPYPESSTQADSFVIYHFISDDLEDKENLTYVAEEDGLHVNVDHVSAFIIGWKEKANIDEDNKNDNIDDGNILPDEPLPDQIQHHQNNFIGNINSVNTGDHNQAQLWLMICLLILFSGEVYYCWKHYIKVSR